MQEFIISTMISVLKDMLILGEHLNYSDYFLLGLLLVQDASERAALLQPGLPSDGQFYSPPESEVGKGKVYFFREVDNGRNSLICTFLNFGAARRSYLNIAPQKLNLNSIHKVFLKQVFLNLDSVFHF